MGFSPSRAATPCASTVSVRSRLGRRFQDWLSTAGAVPVGLGCRSAELTRSHRRTNRPDAAVTNCWTMCASTTCAGAVAGNNCNLLAIWLGRHWPRPGHLPSTRRFYRTRSRLGVVPLHVTLPLGAVGTVSRPPRSTHIAAEGGDRACNHRYLSRRHRSLVPLPRERGRWAAASSKVKCRPPPVDGLCSGRSRGVCTRLGPSSVRVLPRDVGHRLFASSRPRNASPSLRTW